MRSLLARSPYTCASKAVATLLLFILASSSTSACSTVCDPSSSTFETNIAQAEVIAVAYLWKDISPPIKNQYLPWETKYYQGHASSVYKGNEKLWNGEIIVRSVGICDSFPVHQHVVVFGDIVYEKVEGFGTPMPVLQPNACTASGRWSALAADQQNQLEDLDPQQVSIEEQASPIPAPVVVVADPVQQVNPQNAVPGTNQTLTNGPAEEQEARAISSSNSASSWIAPLLMSGLCLATLFA